jgi:DNA-binding PadR family transcriptional regulator
LLWIDASNRYVGHVIDLAVLGVLRQQELHGYELRRRIAELLGARELSFGSLYPALTRLERAGAVKTVEANTRTALPVIPMTGSLSGEATAFLARRRALADRAGAALGRGRKVFGITDVGERLLDELVDDPASDERTFALKVAFCAQLGPARRLALFERRRARVVERLATVTQARAGDSGDPYLASLRDHERQSLALELAWVESLLTAERSRSSTPDQEDHQP